MSATQEVAHFVAQLSYEDIPPEVVARIKVLVLDYIGYASFGIEEPLALMLGKVFRGQGGAPEATVIGRPWKLPATNAAFINGALGHITELDDTGLGGHPGDSIIPAGLATAELVGASGKTLLTALVAGYEVNGAIARAIQPSHYNKRWHPTGTVNTFGAALAVGKVMGLAEAELVQTIALAGGQAAGNFAHLPERGMLKDFNPGRAAANGVLAALLAREGFFGASDMLENPWGFCALYSDEYDLGRLTEGLGESFRLLEEMTQKLWPGCRNLHPARDGLLHLIQQHGIRAGEVKQVRVRVDRITNQNVNDPEPWAPGKGAYGPRFSLQFVLAVALQEGEEGMWRLFDKRYPLEKLNDPALRELISRIQVIHDPALDRESREGRWRIQGSEVEVETSRGTFTHRMEHPKGDVENPLTEEEFARKLRLCTAGVFSPAELDRIKAAVARLDALSDVNELTAHLRPAGGA